MLVLISLSLLTIVVAIEASTSLARIAGFKIGNPYSGLTLESMLSLLSRGAMFFFTPIFGFLADTNMFEAQKVQIVYGSILLSVGVLAVKLNERLIVDLYCSLINGILKYGSIIRSLQYLRKDYHKLERSRSLRHKTSVLKRTRFNQLQVIHCLVYIPFYLSWPLAMIFISFFHDFRATILSANTLMTAVSSMTLTLLLDPLMAKLSCSQRLSQVIYHRLLSSRMIAACCASTILLIFYHIILN